MGAASVACTCRVPVPVLRKPCLQQAGTRIDWPFVRLARSSWSRKVGLAVEHGQDLLHRVQMGGCALARIAPLLEHAQLYGPVTADTCMRIVTPGAHSSRDWLSSR